MPVDRFPAGGSERSDTGSLLQGRVAGYRQGARPVSRRLFMFAAVTAVAFGGLLARLGTLQIGQGAYYRSLADYNRIRRVTLRALRGIIYDRRGQQLVENVPQDSLAIVPADLPTGERRRQILARLQDVTGISSADIEKGVEEHAVAPFEPALIQRHLSPDQALVLQEQEPAMPGVQVEVLPQRRYVQPVVMAHIIGYTGAISGGRQYEQLRSKGYLLDDTIGKEGIELAAEPELRGTFGVREVETDATGRVVREIARTPAVPGADVRLHLDLFFQQALAGYLQDAMDASHKANGPGRGEAGCAIVMDPRDGSVLAMVSLPSYDVNEFTGGISQEEYARLLADPAQPMLDRAIAGQYPPGSCFKQVTASAALEEGKIAVDTPITCHGVLEVAGYPFYCWNRGGHGTITVVDGLAQSCDVFFYTCANLLGDITLARYARVFGVGEVTGVELDGEALGVAPDRNWKTAYFKANSLGDEPWYIGDTLHAGIGQGYVLVTPLQMARLTCAVANGGRLYNPTLIRSAAPAGSAATSGAPRLERGLGIDPAHLEVVRQGMRQSVLTGTSYMLRGKPYEPAGKTGTAEYGLPDAHDVLPSHAWFTSFAPTSAPEVVVTVFIEGGGEGSTFAQPVAVKALDYYFANRDALRER